MAGILPAWVILEPPVHVVSEWTYVPYPAMRQTFLHDNWVFNNATPNPPYVRSAVQYQPWLPAQVPGYVHLDLAANGIIPDPFTKMSELGSRWVDESDWTYKTVFEWSPESLLPRRIVRFEGLDTVAEVFLNDVSLGHFDNMFVPVELDVSSNLTPGSNKLEVRFCSPVRVGEVRRAEYFAEEGLAENLKQFDERAFVRKAQYMSAWDWGPRLASSGIWQPVSLLEYSARIISFSVLQEPLSNGTIRVYTETKVEGVGPLTLSFGDECVTSSAENIQEIDFIVTNPILWWPNGMGDQHLYAASAKLAGGHEIHKKIGLRTVCLEQKPDEYGECFTFVVNGRKVWARGANWIPDDSFPCRVTSERYRTQAFDCKALGMNMLRVWGGGLYELEGFYDACDEAGLLVWQDFMYGCSYYPDGETACKIAEAEAAYHVERLRDRASLALWCGNNENLVMWQTKWGGEASPPRYYGENIYDKVLPAVIKRLDPQRSYIASSPIGQSNETDTTANDGGYGDSHYWDVWHGRGDWVHYRDSNTRFSSEFGFASSCTMHLWQQYTDIGTPGSPQIRWHDKTGKEWEKFYGYVTTHYPEPKSLEDWTYYSQLNQRDALKFGIEHWRRTEYCQGTLIWQFNDCWPVQSWAVQDYSKALKPAGYELKRLYADRLVSLDRSDAGIDVYLVYDGQEKWSGTGKIEQISLSDGTILFSEEFAFDLAPRERKSFGRQIAPTPTSSLLRVTAGVVSSACLFAEPKESTFSVPGYHAWVEGDNLHLEVKGVAVDLAVWDPDCDAYFQPVDTPLTGIGAITAVHEVISWKFASKPGRLSLRSLAGEVTIDVP